MLKALAKEIVRFYANDFPEYVRTSLGVFPHWRQVKLGLYRSHTEYRQALTLAGCKHDGIDDVMFTNVDLSPVPVEVNLIKLSMYGMGLKDTTKHSDVCKKAQELGLGVCPPEVGLALRLQYLDQIQVRSFLIIGMEPVADRRGHCGIFGLGEGEFGPYIQNFGSPDHSWGLDKEFVWIRPT